MKAHAYKVTGITLLSISAILAFLYLALPHELSNSCMYYEELKATIDVEGHEAYGNLQITNAFKQALRFACYVNNIGILIVSILFAAGVGCFLTGIYKPPKHHIKKKHHK